MEKAWQAEGALPVQRLENNRFIIEFESEQMHNFLINGGPWRHKGDALIVVPFDGFCRPSEVVIDAVNVWVRFYDVPVSLRNAAFSAVLAKKVSARVLDSGGPVRNRNFLRARVALILEEPLKPVVEVKIKDKGVMSFEVGYENVPFFCFICGRMGHSKRECPEQDDDSEEENEEEEMDDPKGKKKKLGEWMRKSPLKRSAEKQRVNPAAGQARANRALNFSGEQLARIQAASSATRGNGGKRKTELHAGEAHERSPLRLPWKVNKELSEGVQRLSVEASKGEYGSERVSGINSYVGSSDQTMSEADFLHGRETEVSKKGMAERLRAAKAARGAGGDSKREKAAGPSPSKEISKPKKKKLLKESTIAGAWSWEKGNTIEEEKGAVAEVENVKQTGVMQLALGGEVGQEDAQISKLAKGKLGDLTGTREESRQGQ
ncbi:unnamed protein product [Urochloa humidicola]